MLVKEASHHRLAYVQIEVSMLFIETIFTYDNNWWGKNHPSISYKIFTTLSCVSHRLLLHCLQREKGRDAHEGDPY